MERKRGVPATRLEEELKADSGPLPLRKGEEDIAGGEAGEEMGERRESE